TDAEIVMFRWVRPDLQSEDFVFIYKDGRLDENRQHEAFRGRVELRDPEMKDGDFSVILKNVRISDTGSYECYVGTNGNKPKLINNIISSWLIQIQSLLSRLTQFSRDQCPLSDKILALQWTRPDLDPDYVFVYRDGRFDRINQHPSFKERVELKDSQMKDGDVSVTLKNVTFTDTGTYECRYYPTTVNKNVSQRAVVLIPASVSFCGPDPEQIEAKPGEDVTLQCRGSKDDNVVMLRWVRPDLESRGYVFVFRDHMIDEEAQYEAFRGRVDLRDPEMKDGDFSVILKNVRISDTGSYECYGGHVGLTVGLTVIVYFASCCCCCCFYVL
uniref:Ig-like domain-containing protein n=1 Tax=Mastacembelus armatus TaxID=205130 RepID=A0A7N8XT60_9TELE